MDYQPPTSATSPRQAFAALRRFARPRVVVERCELCSTELTAEHPHLLDLTSRKLTCACDACAILFSNSQGTRYRRVPRDSHFLPNFRMTDLQWEALLVPIGLAFFFYSTPLGKVIALYPSPAGATESHLPLEAWQELVASNPILTGLEPDVEALLVNRMGTARDHYRVPIDACYKLVGLIRTHWRGLSGGAEVQDVIGQFFAGLRGETSHA